MLLEPKEVEINGKMFVLSKFPAIAGREIICKYPLSGVPKLGEYAVNEETMLKLMSYVGVPSNDRPLQLTTKALIDNHVGNWETLVQVEWAMLEYNCSFFQDGRISTFLSDIVQNLPQWTIKMLTALSQQLSPTEKQHSTN
jgi:hypothetical protein